MFVTIAKSEKEAMEFACAVAECKVEFFTIESTVTHNPEALKVQVTDVDGDEITPARTFYLARILENKLERDKLAAKQI